jgi:hypothetical protein
MISKTVILARQSVETKYLRVITTDSCQQQLFCRRQFSAILSDRHSGRAQLGKNPAERRGVQMSL